MPQRRRWRSEAFSWLSIALDVGRLDDRPPLLDLGLLERGEPLRRLLFLGRDVETEFGELRFGGRIGEHLHHRAVELGDHVFRRAFGRPETEPSRHIEPGY